MERKTVSLSLDTILRECSLNPNLRRDHFYYFAFQNRENIHEVFKYKKFNDDFVSQLDCFNDGNHVVGMIRPSYDLFLRRLCFLLNAPVRGTIKDDEELTKRLLSRVDRLKQVTSEQELEIEFPLLARDLRNGRRYYRDLQVLRQQEGYSEKEYASGEHYYYSCAMKKSLPNFVITQAELYRRFVEQRKELQARQQKMNFNRYLKANFDLDKLFMYVVHEYLTKAEGSKDHQEIKFYIDLVEKYINSSRKKDVTIVTDSGMKVDIDNINSRLENLKRIISDDSSLVDWIIIPEGRDYDRVQKTPEHAERTISMDYEELERLRKKGERQRSFFESSPYIAKAIGLRKYHGYVAYIYPNGEVLIDRSYESDVPKTAEGNAIYHMKAVDFETLSKLDKPVLIKHPKARRMYHTNTWEQRVSRIISRAGTEEDQLEAKKLVKRLKEKSE